MSLKEQVYSVLFVSSAERFNIGFPPSFRKLPVSRWSQCLA